MKKLFTALMLVLALVAPFAAAQTYTSPEYRDGDVVMSTSFEKSFDGSDWSREVKVVCPEGYFVVEAWTENEEHHKTKIDERTDLSDNEKHSEFKWAIVKTTSSTWSNLFHSLPKGGADFYALCRATSNVNWADVMKLNIGDVDFRLKDNDATRYKVDDIVIGSDLKLKLTFEAKEDVKDVFIEAKFSNENFESETLKTNKFDIEKDSIYTKTFVISVPEEFEEGNEAILTIKLGKENLKKIYLQPKVVFRAAEKDLRFVEESLVTEAEVVNTLPNEIVSESKKGLVIAVSENFKEIKAGENAEYSMILTNNEDEAKIFVLKANDVEWADVQLSNNVLILESKESKQVKLYVSTNKEAEGLNDLSVSVLSDNKNLKDINFNAYITETSESKVSRIAGTDTVKILEVSLIVLVIILVLLLVIVGLSRMKRKNDDKEDEDDDDENYY